MSCDVVYIVHHYNQAHRNGEFVGIGTTVRGALEMAMGKTNQVEAWIQDHSTTRVDFAVYAYDMTTTPPTGIPRSDFEFKGGPVRDDA